MVRILPVLAVGGTALALMACTVVENPRPAAAPSPVVVTSPPPATVVTPSAPSVVVRP